MSPDGGATTLRDRGPGTATSVPDPDGPPYVVDLDDERFRRDPWPAYAWYRENDPVAWSEPLSSHVAFGYEHVRTVLTSPKFTVVHPFRASRRAFGPSMLDQEGTRHTVPRSEVSKVLRPRAVRDLAQRIVPPLVTSVLDDALAEGDPRLADRLAERVPMAVTCRLLGLPVEDGDWLWDAMRALVAYVDHEPVPLATVVSRREELREYFDAQISAGRGNGHLLAVLAEDDRLAGADVVNNAILLLAAGTETTSAAITTLLRRAVLEPDAWASLRADRNALAPYVEEHLRHEPPLHLTLRFAAQPTELGGVALEEGAPVQVCMASANRDPEVFTDPDAFLPHRSSRMPMTFGAGRHVCLGMGLAAAELEIVLGAVLDRIEVPSVVGAVPAVQGRTFRHASGLRLDYGEAAS
ncbi:cytochrome P450 [Cellulosimicrobium marinum]|uniref:cytochrome P450 n=1 Tax=Cellulosimicrobium marinum TaxID=1638992 RepID=UPI001E574EED|nr:cytochrome P450 [Cellulosimicrobium marinum]MCB7135709.1 cytochrome P450 [Cellulosimicrobium marinum]